MIDQKRLKELLTYDESSGIFYRKLRTARCVRVGDVAGTKSKDGYIRISVDGCVYAAHRLVWLYVHGQWPDKLIDHVNNVRCDNRLINLRQADANQNARNCVAYKKKIKDTPKGVSWNSKLNKYCSYIKIDGKTKYLGSFITVIEAAEAYRKASYKHFGNFARY